MKRYNKLLIVIGVALGILILANPTMNDFKNYCGNQNKLHKMVTIAYSRESNFLIFSIYKREFRVAGKYEYRIKSNMRYIGFFKNFIYLSEITFPFPE